MFNILLRILEVVLYPFVVLFSPVYYLAARTGIGISFTRRLGFQPVRVHYYQPVPEYEKVPDEYFLRKQEFPGFSIDREKVLATLNKLSAFSAECRWPEEQTGKGSYYSQNPNFGYSSAAVLHGMIRAHGSKKVVEIGSGFSSLITLEALKKNRPDGGHMFTCIEPYPAAWLAEAMKLYPGTARLIQERSEHVAPEAYVDLEENDILFIDSSHVAKLNGDVNFLFLQVLPRLPKGVIVHIHDIYIPYEYPRVHFYGRHKMFWNEQYLLEAFLTGNRDFEVIFPGYYVQTDMAEDFRQAFPGYEPSLHRTTSSFWLKKVK